MSPADLARFRQPPGWWPPWVCNAAHEASAIPSSQGTGTPPRSANCQRYAYAFLELFGRHVPPRRSSELWSDEGLQHVPEASQVDLDLVLFNRTGDAWGAHVAFVLGDRLLHLRQETGRPELWRWDEFSRRPEYSRVVGIVRIPECGDNGPDLATELIRSERRCRAASPNPRSSSSGTIPVGRAGVPAGRRWNDEGPAPS